MVDVGEAAEPGTNTWYWPVGNHRELGMEGEITVQEGQGGQEQGAGGGSGASGGGGARGY